jgi:hypothetical protein
MNDKRQRFVRKGLRKSKATDRRGVVIAGPWPSSSANAAEDDREGKMASAFARSTALHVMEPKTVEVTGNSFRPKTSGD